MRFLRRATALLAALTLLVAPSLATWSIVVVDTATGEVCVAGASCLNGVKKVIALVRVGEGAAASQATGDNGAVARMIIWAGMEAGKSPDEILVDLQTALGGQVQARQFGIASLLHAPVTFTGTIPGDAAGGVSGEVGTLRYAIQGNVMTGPEVWLAAELALLTSPGDLSQRAMAAMEAARSMGGDGRCSCSQGNPTGCGAPPPYFRRTSLSAFLVVARIGDRNGICDNGSGCVSGEYYANLAHGGNMQKPDPVFGLQRKYADWRIQLGRVPDQVTSSVTPDSASLAPGASVDVFLDLLDFEGGMVDTSVLTLSVERVSNAAPVSFPAAIQHLGQGIYQLTITAGASAGSDTWRPWVETASGRRIALQPDVVVQVSGSGG